MYKYYIFAWLFCGAVAASALTDSQMVSLEHLLRPLAVAESELVSGSAATSVAKPVKTFLLGEAQLLEALQDDIADRLEPDDAVRLSLRAKWQPVRIAQDADLLIYTDETFTPDSRGNWFPQVVLKVDGEIQEQWRLPLLVSLFRPVHMTARRLDKGESPTDNAIQSVTCDIYKKRGMPIPASADLTGYELTRTLAEGQMLSWSDLVRRPDVRRGEMVNVSLERGALTINMQAQCLADAVIGEPVALRNLRSRQQFSGLVVGANLVRIQD